MSKEGQNESDEDYWIKTMRNTWQCTNCGERHSITKSVCPYPPKDMAPTMSKEVQIKLPKLTGPYFDSEPPLDKICILCGEPIRNHIIGGPGAYHPGTIKPDAIG